LWCFFFNGILWQNWMRNLIGWFFLCDDHFDKILSKFGYTPYMKIIK
jgi:hypothetical protein